MTAEEYRRAGELFDQTRELPEEERAAVLDASCQGNEALRAQVERLLEADRAVNGGPFLQGRAIEEAARLVTFDSSERWKLPDSGTVIGNYRLGARIGAGGMGVVYEGQDLRLERRVAIKILAQPSGDEDPDLIKRFQQEALAVSVLNHPNIVSIFHADFDQGCSYIAMEFVEGKTLRQLVAAEPEGLESKTILEVIAQTASALSAAHEAGIVHRDIKPENIMVRPDGFVKVLDFGLAKRSKRQVNAELVLKTRPGLLAGTIQYLSPEQVAGKTVDARSDVFSLGVVAYELATGGRPFDGPTDGTIFDAILNRNPPAPSSIRSRLGTEIDALILRALEKDPELRFQTANDMRAVARLLARDSQISSATEIRAAQQSKAERAWRVPLLAALAGMAVAISWFALRTPAPALPNHFESMTFGRGEDIFPNLLPDGKQFIYASSARGNWDIYLQRVGGSSANNLTADTTADNTEPAVSRDGSRIAFRSERGEGGLFVMEATGENPRRISARGHLPSWSPDGKAIVYCDGTFIMPNDRGATVSRLHVLDLTTNIQRELPTGDAVQPNWSPHGQRIAYWGIMPGGGNREIFTVPAEGGQPLQVTDDPAIDVNPVWSPSGRELYFISDRGGTMNIWRIAIDERSGRTSGKPEPVTTPAVYVRYLSWSADGTRFLYSQAQNRIQMSSIAFDRSHFKTTGDPVAIDENFNIGNFSVSADESKVVHDTVGDPHEDLWIVNLDGSGRRKLTSDSFRNRLPAWSPDGEEVLFISTRSGRYQEWIIRADGSGLRQLTAAGTHVNAGVWIDGGRRIVASLFELGLAMLDPAATTPITEPKMLPGIDKTDGSYAFVSPPDNGLMLGHINGNGDNPLLIYSLAEGKLTPLGIKGTRPAWIPGTGNRYLIFLREDACFLYDRTEKRERKLFSTPHNQMYFLQLGGSGERIYFSRTIRDAHLWMGQMTP